MLEKKFILPLLFFPGISLASTATESLSGVTRDIFDNVTENPAYVNQLENSWAVRLGKQSGLRLLTQTDYLGLAIQINTSNEIGVYQGTRSSKGAPKEFTGASTGLLTKAAEDLSPKGMPLTAHFGSEIDGIKWGVAALYQSIGTDDSVSVAGSTGYSPSYAAKGVKTGVLFKNIGVSAYWVNGVWELESSRARHDGNFETPDKKISYMPDAVSKQDTQQYGLIARYATTHMHWFLSYDHQNSDFKIWDLNDAGDGGSTYDADDALLLTKVTVGAERAYPVRQNLRFMSKTWFEYTKLTDSDSRLLSVEVDKKLSGALGAEIVLTPWATLRTGAQGSLWGSSTAESTIFQDPGQAGKSEKDDTSETYWMRAEASPTLGIGMKFGNYAVDATLAQDGTSDIGFTDKIFGKIELTAFY